LWINWCRHVEPVYLHDYDLKYLNFIPIAPGPTVTPRAVDIVVDVHMHERQGRVLGAHTFLCVRPPGWPSKRVASVGMWRGKENLYITDVVVVVAGCRRSHNAAVRARNGVTSLRRRSVEPTLQYYVMCYYSLLVGRQTK